MFFKWTKGRQDSGYEKIKLLESNLLKFDLYLIRFKEGSRIDSHKDPVEGHEHHRLNVVLKHAKIGGEFEMQLNNFFHEKTKKTFTYFRPDMYSHKVHEIEKGTRYVLSFGWLRSKNEISR